MQHHSLRQKIALHLSHEFSTGLIGLYFVFYIVCVGVHSPPVVPFIQQFELFICSHFDLAQYVTLFHLDFFVYDNHGFL